MERKIILYALPLFALAVAIDFLLDFFREKKRYRINDSVTSLSSGFLGTTGGLLTLGFVGFFYGGVYRWYHVYSFQDSALTWFLAAFVYDFFYYWYHRAHHRINIFWAIHATHHNSQYYNFTTALRQSALGFLTVWPFFLPMAFLGFSYEHYLFGAGLSTFYGFFTHTEAIKYKPWLEYIFVGPSNHRVHHGTNDRYLDTNYGSILIIWDRMFGTFSRELPEDPVRYGTTVPLNSFNPFWANFSLHWSLVKDAIFARKWTQAILVFFKEPGWHPIPRAASAPVDANKQPQQDYERYHVPIRFNELVYVAFNFGLATLAVIHVMVSAKLHSTAWIVTYIVILWSTLLSNAFFLDRRSYRIPFEAVRLIATALLAFYAARISTWNVDVLWFYSVSGLSLFAGFLLGAVALGFGDKLTARFQDG